MKAEQVIEGGSVEICKTHEIKNDGSGFTHLIVGIGGSLNSENIGDVTL